MATYKPQRSPGLATGRCRGSAKGTEPLHWLPTPLYLHCTKHEHMTHKAALQISDMLALFQALTEVEPIHPQAHRHCGCCLTALYNHCT